MESNTSKEQQPIQQKQPMVYICAGISFKLN
jgi:hypothetical protein